MNNRHQGMEARNGCLWWVEKRRSKHHEADDNDADVGTECVWVDEWWWQWRLWVYIVVVVVARGSKRRSGSPPDGECVVVVAAAAWCDVSRQSVDNLVATALFAVRGWDCEVRGEGAEFLTGFQCSVKRLAFGIATTEVVHDDLRVKKTSLACVCEPESHAKCPAQAHLARINSQLARDIDGRG
ncbi:hypothetical protein BD410DRAFT_809280 [Rickenella mellea]|uniref:Uncharacterized protein n=1 Tax=Rickenella mellea TaxID=50990 RepID=A0A4Y7PIW8_9AGAM|nr:hypothetical protein BD410DRAFT_809280 [Rickenella mellea]